MTASRWWTSTDGWRSIDLAAVVVHVVGDGDHEGVVVAEFNSGHQEVLARDDDADSFLAALRAWREAQERSPVTLEPGAIEFLPPQRDPRDTQELRARIDVLEAAKASAEDKLEEIRAVCRSPLFPDIFCSSYYANGYSYALDKIERLLPPEHPRDKRPEPRQDDVPRGDLSAPTAPLAREGAES